MFVNRARKAARPRIRTYEVIACNSSQGHINNRWTLARLRLRLLRLSHALFPMPLVFIACSLS